MKSYTSTVMSAMYQAAADHFKSISDNDAASYSEDLASRILFQPPVSEVTH